MMDGVYSCRVRLEHTVEQEYRKGLQSRCRNERLTQQRYVYYGYREKAEQMQLPNCQELTDRFGSRPGLGLAH